MLFEKIDIIDENFTIRKDMYVEIRDDKIHSISKNRPFDYSGTVYDGSNKLLSSGFFNTHCHASMTLIRGYGEGLPLQQWLEKKIFPYESQMTESDVYYGALLGIIEMIKCGTVSFSNMYMHLNGVINAAVQSGIKANVCHDIKTFDNKGFFHNSIPHLFTANHLTKNYGDLIKIDASIHAEYTSSPELVKEVIHYAKSQNLNMHLHLSETQKEVADCKSRHNGLSPVKYFESLGLFELATNAAHCIWKEFFPLRELEIRCYD